MEYKLTHVNEPKHLPWAVYKLFFDGMAVAYKGKKLSPKAVVLKTGQGTVKKIQIGDFIYLEQNPHKNSDFGRRARKGHKILWIIHAPTGKYVGRVMDGGIEKL